MFNGRVPLLINVKVKGLIRIGVETRPFYQVSNTLWEKSMGDPRDASSSQDKYRDKLEGNIPGHSRSTCRDLLPSMTNR